MAFPKKLKELCTPAFLYFALSMIGILFSIIQNLGNNKVYCLGSVSSRVPSTILVFVVKIIYILFWTWILNLICKDGHKEIAWFLVLLPFLILFIIAIFFMKPMREGFEVADDEDDAVTEGFSSGSGEQPTEGGRRGGQRQTTTEGFFARQASKSGSGSGSGQRSGSGSGSGSGYGQRSGSGSGSGSGFGVVGSSSGSGSGSGSGKLTPCPYDQNKGCPSGKKWNPTQVRDLPSGGKCAGMCM